MSNRYWMCIIGPVEKEEIPSGGDGSPRRAVQEAFEKMFGRADAACWSGWGLKQKRMEEIQALWNRDQEVDPPNLDSAVQKQGREGAPHE